MSASRTERLLNLLIALLNTKYGLRRSELRQKVYHDTTSSEAAFGRMFERDKGELRQFGFEVETVTDKGWGSDDPATTRYRIGKESNRLPDVTLTPAECTVLILAAQLWEQAALGSAARNAVRKLQAAGGLQDAELPAGVQPRIRPAGQAFEDLVAAIHAQHPVTFSYLAGSTGQEEPRTVEPWGLGSRFGQWYLVGHDRTRGDKRFFRLSRFTSAVTVLEQETFTPPPAFNVREQLAALPELPVQHAIVDVAAGALLGLRKRAVPAVPGGTGGEDVAPATAGFDRLTLPYRDVETIAAELASCGAKAVVAAPGHLHAAVRRRLAAAAAFAAAPVPAVDFPRSAPAKRTRPRTSEDQLKRMLQLVPFLVHNQGLHISEVADRFGLTRKELEDDLRILICSGLPEGYPDDLLDIRWDDDHVYIIQDLDLNRPVRFTVDEACALLTGLEALNGLPGLTEGGALESVTLKLMAAAGEEGLKAAAVSGPEVAPEDSDVLETAREAIRTGAQLRLSYLAPQRDTVSERDVDPHRLYSLDNTWYLEAYCHAAQGLRNFRLDRIQSLQPNGQPASSSAADPADGVPVKLFTPNDDDAVVVLELTRQGAGLADEYYAERTAALPNGNMLAEIRFGSADWLPMFVARHGGAVRILQPQDLADASREWLSAALARYGDENGDRHGSR